MKWIKAGKEAWRYMGDDPVFVPGRLVRMGGKTLLVGHINPLTGTCGCCSCEDDILEAYSDELVKMEEPEDAV